MLYNFSYFFVRFYGLIDKIGIAFSFSDLLYLCARASEQAYCRF